VEAQRGGQPANAPAGDEHSHNTPRNAAKARDGFTWSKRRPRTAMQRTAYLA
jgi:hypothetical protein